MASEYVSNGPVGLGVTVQTADSYVPSRTRDQLPVAGAPAIRIQWFRCRWSPSPIPMRSTVELAARIAHKTDNREAQAYTEQSCIHRRSHATRTRRRRRGDEALHRPMDRPASEDDLQSRKDALNLSDHEGGRILRLTSEILRSTSLASASRKHGRSLHARVPHRTSLELHPPGSLEGTLHSSTLHRFDRVWMWRRLQRLSE